MFEKFIMITAALLVPAGAQAAGLGTIVDKAGPEISPFVYGIVSIVIVGVVGVMGYFTFSFFDKQRMARIVEKASYIAAFGVLLGIGIEFMGKIVGMLNRFIQLVCG